MLMICAGQGGYEGIFAQTRAPAVISSLSAAAMLAAGKKSLRRKCNVGIFFLATPRSHDGGRADGLSEPLAVPSSPSTGHCSGGSRHHPRHDRMAGAFISIARSRGRFQRSLLAASRQKSLLHGWPHGLARNALRRLPDEPRQDKHPGEAQLRVVTMMMSAES